MAADGEARPAMAMAIHGPISRADLPGLCDRVCALLHGCPPATIVHCDVRSVAPDAVTVDALARLQMAARRRGCSIQLWGASAHLRNLVELMGLDEILVED